MHKNVRGILHYAIRQGYTMSYRTYANITENESDGMDLLVSMREQRNPLKWTRYLKDNTHLVDALLQMNHFELKMFAYLLCEVDINAHTSPWTFVIKVIKRFKLNKHIGL